MKAPQIIIQILSRVEGGIVTDDSKFSERAILDLFPRWLQKVWDIRYNGNKTQGANKFIGSANYISVHINYNAAIQVAGADFVLFEIEPPIQLNSNVNGVSFLGDELSGKPFQQFLSLQTYNTAKEAKLIDINDVYFENHKGNILKVWGNIQLKSIYANYIPANVMNCTIYDYVTKTNRLFNPATDDYPMSEDILGTFIDIAAAELFPEAQTPADFVNDSTPVQVAAK